MSRTISEISDSLTPMREQLINHPIYRQMSELRHVQLFMEHHVYAVWDFMSLLKALQRKFGCFEVPWTPSANPAAVRLLNEIAVCEESDDDGRGGYSSHFAMYRNAMMAAGASTVSIDQLVDYATRFPGQRPDFNCLDISDSVSLFMSSTFDVIKRNDTIEMAATFLYGRENLLPELFNKIVAEVSREYSGNLDDFVYYLDRHIEVDEGHHGPAAVRLLELICEGNPKRVEKAHDAAVAALQARIRLWDEILAECKCYSNETSKRLV